MKKLVIICGVCASLLTGCKTSVLDNASPSWAGMTFHEVYSRIADKQDEAFKAEVESLWNEIDKVDTVDGIGLVYTHFVDKIDSLIVSKNLVENQIVAVRFLRSVLDKVVAISLSTDTVKQSQAIAWLTKFRDGIRVMRDVEKNETVVFPDIYGDDIVLTDDEKKSLQAVLACPRK